MNDVYVLTTIPGSRTLAVFHGKTGAKIDEYTIVDLDDGRHRLKLPKEMWKTASAAQNALDELIEQQESGILTADDNETTPKKRRRRKK